MPRVSGQQISGRGKFCWCSRKERTNFFLSFWLWWVSTAGQGLLFFWWKGFRTLGLSSCGAWTWLLCSMWGLSSLTRGQACVPCTGKRILKHWTSRKVLRTDFIWRMLWIFVGTDNVKDLSSHPLQHGLGRVYWFGRASITKCHRLGGLNNRNLFSHNSGGWKSKIKVLAQLVSSDLLSVACRWPNFCCFFIGSSPHAQAALGC